MNIKGYTGQKKKKKMSLYLQFNKVYSKYKNNFYSYVDEAAYPQRSPTIQPSQLVNTGSV